jgi:oligopeptide transport system substrate-binding protein
VRHALRRTLPALLLPLAALAAGAAFGGGSLRARAEFAFCNQDEVKSLDPALAGAAVEARVVTALYEGLTRLDGCSGEPLPGMAESWEVSPDGLSWRIRLRRGSLWTDGSPVTAADFAWSFRRVLHPDTGAAVAAEALACLRNGRRLTRARLDGADPAAIEVGARALDEATLLLELEWPVPHLPHLLALPGLCPVNRACVERWGPAWMRAGNVVTNGPFRLVERRLRDVMRLQRWDGYWGRDEVALRSVDVLAAAGQTTQLNLYLSGQADWVVRPPAALGEALHGRPDCLRGPQAGTSFLRFNVTRPPLDDLRVRQALSLAIDRAALVRDVLRAGERPAGSYVPDVLPGYAPARLPPDDAAAARALLAAAGFPGGAGFPVLELLHPQSDATRDVCLLLADRWREVLGIEVRPAPQTQRVYIDTLQQLRYDIGWSSWIADFLDPLSLLGVFASGNVADNRTGWADPQYDELLEHAAGSSGAARLGLLGLAEARLLDGLPIAPLHERVNVNLVAPRVRGFCDNPLDIHPLRDLAVDPAP